MYFCDKEHEQEFKRLKFQRVVAQTPFNIEDYCYAYYLLMADQYLRDILKHFMDEQPPGDIDWIRLLASEDIHENYRQLVFFAHQLYARGWDNPDFDFLKLLNALSQKPELQEAVFEACRRYSNKSIMENEGNKLTRKQVKDYIYQALVLAAHEKGFNYFQFIYDLQQENNLTEEEFIEFLHDINLEMEQKKIDTK